MEQPNSKYDHLFAIVRFDEPTEGADLRNSISVVSVFRGRDEADHEAKRLALLNDAKGCHYEVLTTRLKGTEKER